MNDVGEVERREGVNREEMEEMRKGEKEREREMKKRRRE